MGVPQSVVSDWENNKLKSWRDVADRLAVKLRVSKGYFAPTQFNSTVKTTEIPVVGEVQAGVFRLALEIPTEERTTIPVVTVRGYERVQLVALRVKGPSMDQLYPDGSHVIVVSAHDTDVRNGDRVVVYQRQGDLYEATIKEVRTGPDGRVALWPRSNHPDHQTPIYLDVQGQDSPEIAYVVVGRYADEDRPASAVIPLHRSPHRAA